MKCNSNIICSSGGRWVIFSIFTELCSHHHVSFQNIFLGHPSQLVTPSISPTTTPTQATTHLPSVSVDLPILDISYEGKFLWSLLSGFSLSTFPRFIYVVPCINSYSFSWLNDIDEGIWFVFQTLLLSTIMYKFLCELLLCL